MGLARTILLKRIRNDLSELGEYLGMRMPDIPDDVKFPVGLSFKIRNVRGYESPGKEITDHKFTIYLSEDYPYERPRVKWKTQIFHPNIMPPSEGGNVCVMAITHWDFNDGLTSFVKALTDLVKNPNPYDPLGSPTCEEASHWFQNNV